MILVLAVLVAGFLAFVVIGGITGRVRMRSCCAVADPRRDARMAGAFADEPDARG